MVHDIHRAVSFNEPLFQTLMTLYDELHQRIPETWNIM